MAYVYYVTTREELKRAIDSKAKYISIKNAEVAKHVLKMKNTSKEALTAILACAGVTATMFWNPIGWVGAVVISSVAAAVAYLSFTLGVGTFWELYEDYEIIAHRIAKLDDGTVVEGELIICIK